MAGRPLALTEPHNARHVYRHILREFSYLPPVCRVRLEPRIHARFRIHRNDPAPEIRLRRANHELRFLRAANYGDMVRMRRVVMLAFGRIGWRRRMLMADLRRLDEPESSGDLEERLRSPATNPRDWLDRWDTRKLLVFAASQARQKLRNSPRPEINGKKLDPAMAVPVVNAWGRPFADKPARTKLQKWWKGLVHRILPPVPRGEWEVLKRLATSEAGPEWRVPARRPQAQNSSVGADVEDEDAADHPWPWERYAARPVRVLERSRSRRRRVLSGLGNGPGDAPYEGPAIGIHRFTPRFWKRLYGEIWQMTAVMEQRADKTGSGWTITWGGLPPQPLRPTAASAEFFEGVDRNGALLYDDTDADKRLHGPGEGVRGRWHEA